MNVYQIALPSVQFNGLPDASQRRQWTTKALNDAGGLTYLGAREGAWISDDGELFEETMHWYEVACGRNQWDALVAYAFQLFPNEQAIYTARVGECEIITRPTVSGGE
jgi:hypothetical protein